MRKRVYLATYGDEHIMLTSTELKNAKSRWSKYKRKGQFYNYINTHFDIY